MTIEEAIKRALKLLGWLNDHSLLSFDDSDAIQLGIEALKRLEELRVKTPTPIYLIEKPLPGETGIQARATPIKL